MLSNPKNKENVANSLLSDWVEKGISGLPHGHKLYLAGGFTDPKRAVEVMLGHHRRVQGLESDHEEADSRMFLHINFARQTLGVQRILLWSNDTDVAMMYLRYCWLLDIEELYLKVGTSKKRWFIAMHVVAQNTGQDFALVFPTLHAISGCDSTSSFSGLGKN